MKKGQKTLVSSVAALASVAGIIAPTAAFAATLTPAQQDAENFVSYAEKTANFYDFNMAFAKVLALPSAQQGVYLARLAAVEGKAKTDDIKAVLSTMDAVAASKDLGNYYKILDLINKVSDQKSRDYLKNDLSTWAHGVVFTSDVTAATDAIIKAWGTKTQADVVAAQAATAKIANAGSLAWCNAQIAEVTAKMPAFIVGVTALNSTTARVALSTPVKDVDFTNFSVDNGLTVVSATLSSDQKSVDVKVNQPFTRQQLYTLTATGLTNLNGDASQDLTGTFKWSVNDAITVGLTSSSLKVLGTANVTVVDQDGKKVTPTNINIVSSNTNIVTVSDNDTTTASIAAAAAGSADVTVKVTLADDTILTNTFTVTVAKASDTLANQGITLVDSVATDAPENTVVFNAGDKTTSLFVTETKEVAMYNTVNGDPDIKPVDFTDAKVTASNPTIATAAITGSVLSVTADAKQTGTASFKVVLKDGSSRTFSVTVKAARALTGISVDTTSVKLSDEAVANAVIEGVNQKTVTVDSIDQYGDDFGFGTAGKVTVTTNTTGLVLSGADLTGNALTFGATDTNKSFIITTTAGKIVDGSVYIKYFKNATDATPIATKVVSVDVVDISATATPTSLDVVAPTSIDANTDSDNAHHIDFTNRAFVLDKNGNRIDQQTATADIVETDNNWVTTTANDLAFQNDAVTLLATSGTVNVNVTSDGITKKVPVKYINSASVPASVTVNTKPVAVKLTTASSLTFEDLIFGALDSNQLVNDGDLSEYIAVKSAATNGGYVYNKPVLTFKNAAGTVMNTGASVYGIADSLTNGNVWTTNGMFSSDKFDVDFAVTNVTENGGTVATSGALTDAITATNAGDAVTFTLVIKGVRVSGTDATKNLLAAPVTINVTVAK